jgi:hypothetical protein
MRSNEREPISGTLACGTSKYRGMTVQAAPVALPSMKSRTRCKSRS